MMQRRRFAQLAAAAIVGLGVTAFWNGSRGGEPFFQRLVFAPGDDPTALSLPVDGAELVEIDRTGTLLVHTGARVRRQPKPHAYQHIDGRRREVSVHFDLAPAGDPRLVVGPYDRTFPLIVVTDRNHELNR